MSDDTQSLKLLSLDGGGIRGLSSLIILRHLMKRINEKDPPKPCEYFDLIGGTSTGGLIAIMLGRLQMSVDECIDKYLSLSAEAFQRKRLKSNIAGRAKSLWKAEGAYQSDALADAFKEAARLFEGDEDALLLSAEPQCRVFVCSFAKMMNTRTLFRSYPLEAGRGSTTTTGCTIWEAARATSAAATFFDPLIIGSQAYVDGATGLNNPVEVVLDEAKAIWPNALSRIHTIVSIGTGVPPPNDFGDNLKGIAQTLKAIATDTEQTHRRFFNIHGDLGLQDRYFRFNVIHGLSGVRLDDHGKIPIIEASTEAYISSPETQAQVVQLISTPCTITEYVPLDQRDDYLGWLPWIDQQHYLNEAVDKSRTDESGLWFVERYLNEWQQSPGTMFWISAPAGSGKTVLASIVTQKIQGLNIGVGAYYFCSFQNRDTQTLRQFKHALLVQLLKGLSHYHPHKKEVFIPRAFQDLRTKVFPSNSPSMDDLDKTIIILSNQAACSFIILDALDECESQRARQEILDFLSQLLENVVSDLHIMVFSRPEPDIEGHIAQLPVKTRLIPLDARAINFDIERHLKTLMDHHPYKAWTEDLKMEVCDHIMKLAHGNFRWADLQIQSVHGKSRAVDIRRALKRLPRTLNETYERMLQTIDMNDYGMEALAILRWLCVAARPMRVKEIAELAAFEVCNEAADIGPTSDKYEVSFVALNRFPTSSGITSILSGLITMTKPSRRVQRLSHFSSDSSDSWSSLTSSEQELEQSFHEDMFISFSHFSVLEYLQSDNISPLNYKIRLPDCHWYVAKACLAYIDHYDTESTDEIRVAYYPLLSYACFNLCEHINDAASGSSKMDVHALELLLRTQTSKGGYAAKLTAALNRIDLGSQSMTVPQEVHKIRGHDTKLLDGIQVLLGDSLLLRFAIEAGFDMPEDSMLDAVMDCRSSETICFGPTSDVLRSDHSHPSVVLKSSNDRDIPIDKLSISHGSNQTIGNSRRAAAWEILFRHTAVHINAKNYFDQTALLSAALHGDFDLVAYLLAKDSVETNCRDCHGWSPLICAIIGGNSKIIDFMRIYVDNDLTAEDFQGWNAMNWASYRGYDNIFSPNLRHVSEQGPPAMVRASVVQSWKFSKPASKIEFSPDSTKLAVWCWRTRNILILSLESDENQHIAFDDDHILHLAWSPDSSMIVMVSDWQIVLCDIKTGNARFTLHGIENKIPNCIWAPDSKSFWVSKLDRPAETLFRVVLGQHPDQSDDTPTRLNINSDVSSRIASIERLRLPGPGFRDMAVSPDGQFLCAVSAQSLQVFSTETWEPLWEEEAVHNDPIVTIGRCSKVLLVDSLRRGCQMRDISNGALLFTVSKHSPWLHRRGYFGGVNDEFILTTDEGKEMLTTGSNLR
ncbi:uncharacterized protein JN550_011656 [Neoarthrinium moseri]|uniref:uncharacterized protein n=1 Tax=Neoarthrinium moseri TaxID=1658444 RepID=UPI001FDE3A9E|nr:uncharacterized protein JN550_011656 [Neoarthrinium moseri]KAI1860278.1 hypothetical protein JN550_011656 [Neoarthrinium moseri]